MKYFRGTKRQFSLAEIFQAWNLSEHSNALFQVSFRPFLSITTNLVRDTITVVCFSSFTKLSPTPCPARTVRDSLTQLKLSVGVSSSSKVTSILNFLFRFIKKRTKNDKWTRSLRHYSEFKCQESKLYRIRSSIPQATKIYSKSSFITTIGAQRTITILSFWAALGNLSNLNADFTLVGFFCSFYFIQF